MKKQNKVMALIEKGVKFADEHQREIMLGGAIAGTVVTAVLSWKAGIKADRVLAEQRNKRILIDDGIMNETEIHGSYDEEAYDKAKKDLTIETVKKMAPIVAPPVLAATGTIISVVAGYKVASTQIATLSALYSMSEKALADQLEKTKEIVGPKKAQEIADAITDKKVKETPIDKNTIINTGKGTTLCLDDMSGRYFYSSAEEIKKACNTINKRMMDEYYISLNELYDELGLPEITLGEDVGFNIDDGLIDIDHILGATLHNNETPVLVLNYDISAKYMEHRGGLFR